MVKMKGFVLSLLIDMYLYLIWVCFIYYRDIGKFGVCELDWYLFKIIGFLYVYFDFLKRIVIY